MRKSKIMVMMLVGVMLVGLISGMAAAQDAVNSEEAFEGDFPAAPAVAGLLLEEAGVDNRFGNGKDGGNYIREVAKQMGPGTDFNGVSKYDKLEYAIEIAKFLNKLRVPAGVTCPGEGIFDPIASGASASDNADGTVTLQITAKDICGNGISGLNPLSDFYVRDSVMSGTYYFGTSSIPGSKDWDEQDGVYSVNLDRNFFNARPAGYNDGWYRVWDIYVIDELIEEALELKTTYYMVGSWKLDLYVGSNLNQRFIVINTHEEGELTGFFGVGYDPEGNQTGEITGTIEGRDINMFYDREGYSTDGYTAEFEGVIAKDGNSMSGTWSDYARTDEPWDMFRQ